MVMVMRCTIRDLRFVGADHNPDRRGAPNRAGGQDPVLALVHRERVLGCPNFELANRDKVTKI